MDSFRMSSTISRRFYETEAPKTASESEPKSLILCPFVPRKEVKNRGHIRLHAGATTRALRKGATTRNVEPRQTSQGHVVLARRYVQVGGHLRSVRKHQDGASFAYTRRERRIDGISLRVVNAD
jgi:hypothetical protein